MQVGADKVAVITGAASGIGLALAEALAGTGCAIVLADVETEALASAERRIAQLGVATLAVRTDVSSQTEIQALAAATLERFGHVNILCNNAGVAGGGDAWFGTLAVWEWVVGVNFWGVVHGIREFLPHLIASGDAHVVNTASIAGLLPAFSPPYDAAKHAVVAVSEGLFNMSRSAGLPLGVSCICPGWVRTGIMNSQRNWPDALGAPPARSVAGEVVGAHVVRAIDEGMQPAAVADMVLDAIREPRFWVLPHPEFLELAVDRFHRIAEQLDPRQPEQLPGMPATSQIAAEVIAAMTAAMIEDQPT